MIKQNSIQAWVLAFRPKTLTAATAPIIIAISLAWFHEHTQIVYSSICLIFALIMQIAANLINDLYDYTRGTDNTNRLGPKRACAQGWISVKAMKIGIVCTLIIACLIGSLMLIWGHWWLIAVGILCVVFAFLYTTCLSYIGAGDLLVLVFFGFVPILSTYYLICNTISIDCIIVAFACGLCIDLLLIINNYRDRDTDKQSHKNTLISILGERFGRYQYLSTGILAWLLCLPLLKFNGFFSALLPGLFVIFHIFTWLKMIRIKQGRELNVILGETSRNILFFSLLLSSGLIIDNCA